MPPRTSLKTSDSACSPLPSSRLNKAAEHDHESNYNYDNNCRYDTTITTTSSTTGSMNTSTTSSSKRPGGGGNAGRGGGTTRDRVGTDGSARI